MGDLAGFVASIFYRGIPFVQIPTTIVSQVDSAAGGKTGVNHPQGKNLIGAFHQPRCVLADTDTLNTLEERQLSAGIAEVVKYGVILDEEFFEYLERSQSDINQRKSSVLVDIKVAIPWLVVIVAVDQR